MHGEVSLIAVEFLKALVLGAYVMSTRQLIQFNEEGTKEFLFVSLSIGILGWNFVPQLEFKWSREGLFCFSLVAKVNLKEHSFVQLETGEVEGLFEARLVI
jgi:hypothetical protein